MTRPTRAAKATAYENMDKLARPNARKRKRNAHTVASPDAPEHGTGIQSGLPVAASEEAAELSEPDDQQGCKALFDELGKQYKAYHESVILPGRELQLVRLSGVDPALVHPSVPRANIGQGWTEQDEEAVQAAWVAEQTQWDILPSAFLPYYKLWRLCLQFAECTPWDIVGSRTNLVFELDASAPPATSVNHMWSCVFCHGLSTLVTHCSWPTDQPLALANSLAAALQYVVILRTGDSRPWDPTFGGRDPFRAAFKCFSKNGETPMRKVHEEVREYMARNGVCFPSFSMSHLFLELEKLIVSPTVSTAEQEYGVRAADLRILMRALDNMTHITGVKLQPAGVQYQTAMACRPKVCLPSSKQELVQYHKAAVVEEMRRRHASRRSKLNVSPSHNQSSIDDGGIPDLGIEAPASLSGNISPSHYQSSIGDGMQGLEIEASAAPSDNIPPPPHHQSSSDEDGMQELEIGASDASSDNGNESSAVAYQILGVNPSSNQDELDNGNESSAVATQFLGDDSFFDTGAGTGDEALLDSPFTGEPIAESSTALEHENFESAPTGHEPFVAASPIPGEPSLEIYGPVPVMSPPKYSVEVVGQMILGKPPKDYNKNIVYRALDPRLHARMSNRHVLKNREKNPKLYHRS
ncbi:hypothetical protein NQ176_g6227 [Zarea fungicola]|uniref:Uncharacterized protein n=1 Tax=Zarea fungicola TaxID=93591 RepID=A0ACC1N5I1_9HYPO|nr:hypothetical protein NQ176_g6227 [Lecanicillium fungicola]